MEEHTETEWDEDYCDEDEDLPEIEVRPHEGPQWEFFATQADIAIYGGQAGGGKSWAIVAEPARYSMVPGFKAVLFRRTYPELMGPGGLWEEATAIYPQLGAHMREGDKLDATWPSGARVVFRHMQHEKDKYTYQGQQIAMLGFDELTHFTKGQFLYLLSRNRSTSGVMPYIRATCNPDATSWVADFLTWWIDQDTGLPINERAGALRYFVHEEDCFEWADSKEELIERYPHYELHEIMSVTFIPAKLEDNPTLTAKDPGYRAKLKALPKIERERLLGGNWKIAEGTLIDSDWLKNTYSIDGGDYEFLYQGQLIRVPIGAFRRIATIDTAGTSKERAAEERGDPPSWTCCAIWDTLPMHVMMHYGSRLVVSEVMLLRYMYRKQVDWNDLKRDIPEVVRSWNVQKTFIENAHFGQPLRSEVNSCPVEMVGPVIAGMKERYDAKLERAVASGFMSRLEAGKVYLPFEDSNWKHAYKRELSVWRGLPKETADQIDVSSYGAYKSNQQVNSWGGVVAANERARN